MKLLRKEFRLATSPLSYFFTAFGFMALIPGYPILVGAFFVCLGIYQSFVYSREAGDILYSSLLPIRKSDVVRSKYASTVFFQMLSFALFTLCTVLRMTVLSDIQAYVNNVLMAANLTFLAFVLLIYTAFNTVFLGGFFKTAYYHGKPFIVFIAAAFIIVGAGEALHYLPGMAWVNALGGDELAGQIPVLAVSAAIYILSSIMSMKLSQKGFEKIDIL